MKMVEKSSCLFLYYTAVPDMSNSVTSTPTSSDVASVISVTCSNSCSNKHILDTEEETPCVSHHPQVMFYIFVCVSHKLTCQS